MLTDPQEVLAEQNTVATALTGLAGLARTVRALAAAPAAPGDPPPADDLVHVLLAVASLGDAAAGLAVPAPVAAPRTPEPPGAWLR